MRQLLIGLDAVEWTLVERWAGEGTLPTFRRLLAEGTRARLATPAAWLPDTAWTTLCHGVGPGQLEKYFYVQYEPPTGRLRYAEDAEIGSPPFWHFLGEAGVEFGVADVPHVPTREIEGGFQIFR